MYIGGGGGVKKKNNATEYPVRHDAAKKIDGPKWGGSERNLFDGALDARGMLPAGHHHPPTAVVHVEVVHKQTERLHISQVRQPTNTHATGGFNEPSSGD